MSLRNIDGEDIHRGLYVNAAGQYLLARCRDSVPNQPVGETITLRSAFRVYGELLGKIRPGMDIHRDAEAQLIRAMQEEVPDPEGEAKRLQPLLVVGFGIQEGLGLFMDGQDRVFRGRRDDAGGVHNPAECTVAEGLAIAADMVTWGEDIATDGLAHLLHLGAERIEAFEKKSELAVLVGGVR